MLRDHSRLRRIKPPEYLHGSKVVALVRNCYITLSGLSRLCRE